MFSDGERHSDNLSYIGLPLSISLQVANNIGYRFIDFIEIGKAPIIGILI